MSEAVRYEFRDATIEDVEFLSTRLREIDLRELSAVSGRSPDAVLKYALRFSDICRAGIADGETICMYGVQAKGITAIGMIWMLGTDALDAHAMKVGRETYKQTREMIADFDLLENWVHIENKKTIRWLMWLGFKFEKPKPYGLKGELYSHFYMENK